MQPPPLPARWPCGSAGPARPLPGWLTRQTLEGEWTHYPNNYCQRPSYAEIKLVTDSGRRWTCFCSEPKAGGTLSVLPSKQPRY